MKISNTYSINNAFDLINRNKIIFSEIEEIINNCQIRFTKGSPKVIKDYFNENFSNNLWIQGVKLGTSNLSINYIKENIGICLQIGNVARTYADILKLNYFINREILDVGVLIVPHALESRKLGNNYANFERLKNEFNLFSSILSYPLLILEMSET